jgi:biotin carboxylase
MTQARVANWWEEQPAVLDADPRYLSGPPMISIDSMIERGTEDLVGVYYLDSKPWVLIAAGGILQIPAVTAARELGHKVIVSDRDLDCPCAGLADHFVELSTFDVDGHIRFVKDWPHGLAAVFTAGADPIVTVAEAARAAGCHGLPPDIARTCASKVATRQVMERFRVPQPDFCVVDSVEKLQGVIDENIAYVFHQDGYILKATGSSGSRGHTRGTREDFQRDDFAREALERAQAYSPRGVVLLEELLSGKELSVETLWYDGHMIPLNAVERPFENRGAYAIELGHYNPAVLDAETYTRVWDVMRQAGVALGMDDTYGGHILKGDLILTGDGPKVLELTTRLSGGFDSQKTTPLAHGADYTKGALLLATDNHLSDAMPYFMPRWRRHAACLAVFGPPEGGIIKEIQGLDTARLNGEVILRFDVGDELPPLTDCAARVGFCFAAHDDPEIARHVAQRMVNEITVTVE